MILAAQVLASQPSAVVGGGLARTNGETNVHLGAQVCTTDEGLVLGFRAATSLRVPMLRQTSSDGRQWNDETYDGVSTLTTLTALVGWKVRFGQVSLTAGITPGGANVSHRRLIPSVVGDSIEATAHPAWLIGALADIGWHMDEHWSIHAMAGYDVQRSTRIITDNPPPALSYRAVFADARPWFNLSVGFRPAGRKTVDTSDGARPPVLVVGAIIASWHPFDRTGFNEYNPGLFAQYRWDSTESPWYAEAGAYMYSLSDRAVYAGAGKHWEFLADQSLRCSMKFSLFAGALVLNTSEGASPQPVIVPRLTLDVSFGSIVFTVIPAGSATALGLSFGVPLS